jgi:hypothetical protein
MRAGRSFTLSTKYAGIDPRTAKEHLHGYIHKKRGRWHARSKDKIERGLLIYTRGRIRVIIVNDSEVASTIGEYLNDIKRLLTSGNLKLLEKYKNVVIRDANGKLHRPETRLERLEEIELSREEVPFSDIYDYD